MKHITGRVLKETLIEGRSGPAEISVSFSRPGLSLSQFSCLRWKLAYKSLHGREEPCQLGTRVSQLGQQGRGKRESRLSGKITVMRQVQGQAGKSIHSSGWVPVARVRHSPVILGQVHGNEAGSRSSWEVSPRVRDQQDPCPGCGWGQAHLW